MSAIAVVVIVVLVNVALFNIGEVTRALHNEQAFEIAEAGIEYYRWHLSHAPQDFTNGTGQAGPYTVAYADKDGNPIGQFILDITPPIVGSTIATIQSTGKLDADPSVVRKLRVKLAIPSVAKYATVANDKIRFGQGTVVYGPIHSNDGIHFDGFANNIVTSAKAQYDDPDHTGSDEFGVHTHQIPPPVGGNNPNFIPEEAPPTDPVPIRNDVFAAGRQFPVPAIDFTSFTYDLAQIAANAGNYFGPSGGQGYEIVLNTNDTFDIYEVSSVAAPPANCTNVLGERWWGTWSIAATTTLATTNYPIPANGLIFVEDHVWVSGTIDTARVTIASGKFPEDPNTNTSIAINGNLLYTNYDGQDVIGLIAQNNFTIGLYSAVTVRIDAALIAKNGRAGRHYYKQPGGQSYCGSTALRSTVTLYGMIATNKRYGFSWSCGGVYCSGYANRNIIYDPNLLYGPPPSFPLTSDQYQVISWEEVK